MMLCVNLVSLVKDELKFWFSLKKNRQKNWDKGKVNGTETNTSTKLNLRETCKVCQY